MAKDGAETAEPKQGGALAGVKVVDLTRVLGGPFATQLLGDHGADVIKLEPPQGDEVRDWALPSTRMTLPISSVSTATNAQSALILANRKAAKFCCGCLKMPTC
jgi:crotonobetainyl-CoA:carnitine CoA-transferase CaiB-like acyl-CoA transferase